ncbi:MAG: hypothetical protein K1X63_13385 [Chitinophagales bacterium]|nr:hypothetical protein [Chitinophagales bacterium]
MAINKNHEFEDLDGVKCAVVERNASQARVDFLKPLLEYNGYTVIVVASPPPKAAVKPAPATPPAEEAVPAPPVVEAPPPPSTFTIGVTDVTFNSINAVYGRLLRTTDGHIVTPAYWEQKETVSHDETPYYERTM